MKAIVPEIVLIAGAFCFVIGAALLVFGSFLHTEPHSLAAIGLILSAAGAGMKRRWKQR